MSIGQIQFQDSLNLQKFHKWDNNDLFWSQYQSLQKMRPEIPNYFSLVLRNGLIIDGILVEVAGKELILAQQNSSFQDFYRYVNTADIISVGVIWTSLVARYFIQRDNRQKFHNMGSLQVSKEIQVLNSKLPLELGLSVSLDGSWNDCSEEDFLILEDYCSLFVRSLFDINKKFPKAAGYIKKLSFKKPAGVFAMNINEEAISIQLPYESNSIFYASSAIADELNQKL